MSGVGGAAEVDEVLALLDALAHLDVDGHPEVFADVHRRLEALLADVGD